MSWIFNDLPMFGVSKHSLYEIALHTKRDNGWWIMKDMPRFREETSADEKAYCQGCGAKLHYAQLDGDGLCQECQPEEQENEKETQPKA